MFFTAASFLLHTSQTVKFTEIPITKHYEAKNRVTQNKIKHLYVHMLTDIK